MTVRSLLPDFVKSGNQGGNPELYEVENRTLDQEGRFGVPCA